MLARAGLVFRTLRYVPLQQLWFYFLRRGLPFPHVRQRTSAPVCASPAPLVLTAPLPPVEPLLRDGYFNFLHQMGDSGLNAPDWRSPNMPKLWRYHLHYFDWLKDESIDHATRAFTLEHWIAHNPPGSEDAWEPYTVSLRLINWISYCYRRQQAGLPLRSGWIASVHQQGQWLGRNLEFHIRANHLLKNRIALVWYFLFSSTASRQGNRLHAALVALQAELLEQFHPDGGHYERSPSYHSVCLEHCMALYDALQAANVAVPLMHTLHSVIERGLAFLRAVSFSDQRVALTGDSTLHGGHTWAALRNYWESITGRTQPDCMAPVPVLQYFSDTGFVVWQQAQCKLIVSTGGPSPVYQPGHAHCDASSFELEVQGRRVIVDAGVSQYVAGPLRDYVRSSRAHNVIAIQGQDQNEIWGEFRMGARGVVSVAGVNERPEGVELILETRSHGAAHVGYRHRRTFQLTPQCIQITDTVELDRPATLESRIHLHPDWRFSAAQGEWEVRGQNQRPISIAVEPGAAIELEASHYCPDFGVVEDNQCLLVTQPCKTRGALALTIKFADCSSGGSS